MREGDLTLAVYIHSHLILFIQLIKIPMDWLVVVGSYLSVSLALIGVKAKQSGPTNAEIGSSISTTSTPPPALIPPIISPSSLMVPPPNIPPTSPNNLVMRGPQIVPPVTVNNGLLGRTSSLLPTPNLPSNRKKPFVK